MPLKICIDARKLLDFGIGTYIRNLLVELSRLDTPHTYSLLVPSLDIDLLAQLPERFRAVEEPAGGYSLREQWSISRRLTRIRPDVFHSPHYVLPALLPCPTMVTIHDVIHLLYPQFLRGHLARFYARRMIGRSMRRAQRVVTVSTSSRNDLSRLFPGNDEKIEVIPNGVEPLYFDRLSEEDIRRQLRQLGIQRPYLLFVGNPKPHKNLGRLIDAYARALHRSVFDESLVCVGGPNIIVDGRHGATAAYPAASALGDRLLFVGHVAGNALPALYQGATALAYPSLYEGFGLPVLEAMASGTAVLTSNVPALVELASDSALLVDPTDVDAIAAAIQRLISEPDLRRRLALAGTQRARAYSWRTSAERTSRLYEALGAGGNLRG